jgi:hypothetical protein
LAIANPETGNYQIQIVASETLVFPVQQDGSVTIDVPMLPASCCWDWYCFTLVDNSPKNQKAIIVVRDGKVVRRLSLNQLVSCPLDQRGAYSIEL